MGTDLPAILVDNQNKNIIQLIYLRAKRNLVERDLYRFQQEAFKVNSKL
jgi:hypothetical protein